MVYFTVVFFLFISCCVISCAVAVVVEDAEKGCIINKGDHLLLEYSFFQDNDVMYEVKRPNPLFYFEYEEVRIMFSVLSIYTTSLYIM